MSDARAATDGDLEYWRDTVRSARATNTGTLLAATASMEALLARISADAARIRELEAALTRVATEPDVSCLAGNPMLWPSTIARDALGLPVPGAAPRP